MKKETAIATNGAAYIIDPKTKTAKKVFHAMSELKSIGKELAAQLKTNFQGYLSFVRTSFPGEPIKVDKNSFTIKGYKFTFHADRVEVKDIFNFAREIKELGDLPTPRQIKEFLEPEKAERKFSPKEMREATEKGKRLLEERSEVPVGKLAKVKSTDELEKLKQKALRLIGRVRKKQSSSKAILEEIPGMIPYKPLNQSIGMQIQYYLKGKIRFPVLVNKVEEAIKRETFQKKPALPEKFMGLEHLKYKKVEDVPFDGLVHKVKVDGKEVEKGEWLSKYLLQKDRHPETMVGLMKYLKGEVTAKQLFEDRIKDKTVGFDAKLLKGMSPEQVAVIEDLFYELEEFNPLRMVYNDGTYKKGMKVKMYFENSASAETGRITSVDQGVHVTLSDGTYPVMIGQRVTILSTEKTKDDAKK